MTRLTGLIAAIRVCGGVVRRKGRTGDRHHQWPGEADADRDPGFLCGQSRADAQIGADVARVVAADLERSGLFAPIDPKAFIQDNAVAAAECALPGLEADQRPGAGQRRRRSRAATARSTSQFRLWDVFGGQQIVGFQYTAASNNWRRVAHKIADEIYKRITGEDGYFDTRIVYISESGPKDKRVKRLAIMDQDGENHKYLTDGSVLVLTPRFSPAAQDITYMSYFNNKPRVYLFNIDSGQQEVLGDFPGMTFAPRFSPGRLKRDHEHGPGRQHRHLRHGHPHPPLAAVDGRSGDRYLAVLLAGRRQGGLQLRPRRRRSSSM